jgi:glyoxylase-like metal-dependent hydrolase (beta-lactamase superfamily II)
VYVAAAVWSAAMARDRELGRGERILPGLYRLRLPLPLEGVPHCNAWAIAGESGVVLIDTGMHQPGSLADLERALDDVGLLLEQVRLTVITHAHSDHWGQAGPIRRRSGCAVWIHPNRSHATVALEQPEAAFERRLETARLAGVSEAALARYGERLRESTGSGVAELVDADRALADGVVVETDLGPWTVYETPGHAPSHVCLFQHERRLLISGDHLMGRISLYFEYGYSPDPVGEFLRSLDVIEPLGARLCLSGHGRTFTDIAAHIEGNRAQVAGNLAALLEAVSAQPGTALELLQRVDGQALSPVMVGRRLMETVCYLRHLEVRGQLLREPSGDAERWSLAA